MYDTTQRVMMDAAGIVLNAIENVARQSREIAEIGASNERAIATVKMLEEQIRKREQVEFVTEHTFHAGMYARTVRIPAGVVFTSVLIKIPTLLILNGTCDVLVDNQAVRFTGYNVIPAAAGRKTAYITRSAIELTMIFTTAANTVEEAEAEFTDEVENLLSHTNENDIVVTEAACLESLPQPRS